MILRLFVLIFVQCSLITGDHVEHVSVLSSDFKESQVVYYYGPSTEPGVSFSVDYSSDSLSRRCFHY